MESQQMMELLLKEIRAGQEENRINPEKMDADRRTDKEDFLAKMDANQAKADADRAQMQEMMKMLQAYQAKTDAVQLAMQVTETSRIETATAFKLETEVKTMACQEMEAHQREEEPTSAERKLEAAKQREVPVDEAELMPVGEPKKKRRRDRKLVAEHRRQKPKTSTRKNCGPQKRLAITHRGTTRHAKVARKAPIDRKMSRCPTVARCMRDIVRKNLTQGASGFPRKRLVMANKTITRCASMAEHKRFRRQGDQLESRTSPHKDALERAQEEPGRGSMTQELMKGKEAE
jgi:hypothetical protein